MSSNTKTVIINAFLELLKEKDFSKISITDISEKCNSSRQTFYYHFENIETMLEWAFNEHTKQVCAQIKKDITWKELIEPYSEFLNKYSLLLKNIIHSDSCLLILSLLKKSFYSFYYKYFTENTNMTVAKSDDFFVNCCAAAMTNFVIEEAKKDNPNYEEMNERLYHSIKEYRFAK